MILFDLPIDSFIILMITKPVKAVLAFLSFKSLNQTNLKTYVTHNKYLTYWFLEDNDQLSFNFAGQILSFNMAYTFLYLNF